MANLDSGYQPEELVLFRRLFEECIRGLPESKRTANNQARVAFASRLRATWPISLSSLLPWRSGQLLVALPHAN